MARPKKQIDFEQLEGMCRLQMTKEDICTVLDIDEKTLTARIKEQCGVGFSEFIDRYREEGKMSIRAQQYKRALTGSDRMLRWLGINWLGQSERTLNEHTGKDGGAIEVTVNVVNKKK